MKPARILLSIILMALTIVSVALMAATVLGFYSALERYTASVSTGNPWNPVGFGVWQQGELSVWVYAPYLAPGDATEVEVVVYGGLRVGIDEVHGSFAGKPLSQRGQGAKWGTGFSRKAGSMGQDSLSFRVEAPSDARPGEVVQLRLEVQHTLAVSEAGGGFRNKSAKSVVTLPMQVYSSSEATLRRWGNAGWAALMFGFPVGLRFCLKWAAVQLPDQSKVSREGTHLLAVLVFFACFAYGYLGYLLFALPLLRALSWPAGWSVYFLVGLWLAGSLCLIFYRRAAPRSSDLPLLRDTDELEIYQGHRVVTLPLGWNAMDPPPIRAYELAAEKSADPGQPPALSAVLAALDGQADYIVSASGSDYLELTAAKGRDCYFRGPREGTAVRVEYKGRLTVRVVDPAAVRPEQIALSSDSPELVARCCLTLCSLFGALRIRAQGAFPWLDTGHNAVAAGSPLSLSARLLLQSCLASAPGPVVAIEDGTRESTFQAEKPSHS